MGVADQTAREAVRALGQLGTRVRAAASARFFKTGPGQYGAGDVFMGVAVPDARKVAKRFSDLPLSEIEVLLADARHECRLTGLLILVGQYKRSNERVRARIVRFYLAHAARVNNWDLVDSSAPHLLGRHLLTRDRSILTRLARSKRLWERRIAIVATLAFITRGESADTYALAELLMDDPHDLIHKATGWMLREAGKRVSRDELETFVRAHRTRMPRTMLRYAIEHFPPAARRALLAR